MQVLLVGDLVGAMFPGRLTGVLGALLGGVGVCGMGHVGVLGVGEGGDGWVVGWVVRGWGGRGGGVGWWGVWGVVAGVGGWAHT